VNLFLCEPLTIYFRSLFRKKRLEGMNMGYHDVGSIIEKVIEAHGGASRWRDQEIIFSVVWIIRLRLSAAGPTLRTFVRTIRISMDLKFQR
jgi:hypothetical protein